MKLGIEKTAMIRVRAGISYALTEAMDEGHCGLPTEELTPLAVELLEVPGDRPLLAIAGGEPLPSVAGDFPVIGGG
jgi:exodeoxyribonuclease V alpha subunit